MVKLFKILFFIVILSAALFGETRTGIVSSSYNSNGKLLATANQRGDVAIWDLQTLNEISLLNTGLDSIKAIKFFSDNKKILVAGGFSESVILADIATGKELKRIKISGAFNLSDIFLTADGSTMWVITEGGYKEPDEAWLVDLSNDKFKSQKIGAGDQWIDHQTKNLIAKYSNNDRKITLISALNGKEIRSFEIDKDYVLDDSTSSVDKKTKMYFSGDGSKIFLYRKFTAPKKDPNDYRTYYTNELSAYSVETGKLLKKEQFPVNSDDNMSYRTDAFVTVSHDNTKIFLSEYSDGKNDIKLITAIDANTLQKINETKTTTSSQEWDDLTPDGKYFLNADKTEKIRVYFLETQKPVAELFDSKGAFTKLTVSPDDLKYAGATDNGLIKIWSPDGKELHKISTDLPVVTFLTFSPNGQNLISIHNTSMMKGNDEATITKFKIWSVTTGKLLREFDNRFNLERSPTSFAYISNSGDRLISDCGSENGETIDFCMWNLNTGEFFGQTFPLTSEAFSFFWLSDKQAFTPNLNTNAQIAKFNDDAEYYLWDFANQKMLGQAEENTDFTKAIPQNESGNLIAVNTYNYSSPQFKLIKVKTNEDLKLSYNELFDSIFNIQQNLAVSFIEKQSDEKSEKNFPTPSDVSEAVAKEGSKDLTFEIEVAEPMKNFIELKNTESGEERKLLEGHSGNIIDFLFTNDSKKGISTSFDRTVRVWDLATGKELVQLK